MDLIVVIRTVKERTFEACQSIVASQVDESRICIVNEAPFEKALARCYETGIASGAKWMMTLDGDVLLRPGAVRDFHAAAEAMAPEYFQIEGLVLDKLSGKFRKAGHRIYRTEHLPLALDQIPAATDAKLRPEWETLHAMGKLGQPSKEIDVVFGIHDYEQFYADIYRKAFVHARKHPEQASEFIDRWTERLTSDNDFRIALRGFCDGLVIDSSAAIDKRKYTDRANAALGDLELIEKSPLDSNASIETNITPILQENAVRQTRPAAAKKMTALPDSWLANTISKWAKRRR